MPYEVDVDDIAAVRARLGNLLNELHQTMLDIDVPPILRFSGDSRRLVDVRTRALEHLERWSDEDPEVVI